MNIFTYHLQKDKKYLGADLGDACPQIDGIASAGLLELRNMAFESRYGEHLEQKSKPTYQEVFGYREGTIMVWAVISFGGRTELVLLDRYPFLPDFTFLF